MLACHRAPSGGKETVISTALAETSPSRRAILCDISIQAARVAAALSLHTRQPLVVVDALGPMPVPLIAGAPVPIPEDFHRERLERLAGLFSDDIAVESRAIHSLPLAALAEAARESAAALIVVDATSRRRSRLLRPLPVRLALRANVPVLAVRETDSITGWVAGDRPLRVMVAIDRTPTMNAALDWAGTFGGDLAVEVAAVGLDPPMNPPDWDGAQAVLRTAETWRADLLVAAARDTGRLSRLWPRSATDRLIDEAPMSVAAVP